MLPDLRQKRMPIFDVSSVIALDEGESQQAFAFLATAHTSRLYAGWNVMVDYTFGLISTLLMLLFLPIIALLIYLDSPGPIFYSQERLGLHHKPFRIYKFRSMRVDAEGDGVARWASENDTRVTRIGRILRATHMDELPQAINILQGYMSLVGPRPERTAFATEWEEKCPLYRRRCDIKPGLTGWSQVELGYGNPDLTELTKLQYDLYYIGHRSIALDSKIILKTVVEVMCLHGR